MKINREELLKVLDAVAPGLATKKLIEQTQSFIFKDGFVMTYNDEISIRHSFTGPFEGAVKAAELHQLLNKTKEEELEFEATQNELLIKGKRTWAGIRLEEKISLPVGDMELPSEWFNVPSDMIEGMKFAMFSISKDMSKPIFTCLHCEGSTITSCDRFRLTEFTMSNPVEKPFLIHNSSASRLVKYDPEKYGMTQGWIHFKMKDEVIFSCRAFGGKFPNVEQVKKVEGFEITFPSKLKEMIERAQIFAASKGARIKVKLDKGEVQIGSECDGGWLKEITRTDYKGEMISFIIDPQFFLDALELMPTITIGNASRNMKMKGENFIHVVALMKGEAE